MNKEELLCIEPKKKQWEWNRPKQQLLKDWSKPESESHGDCWRCCVAAVIQMPVSEVPDFLGISIKTDRSMDCITQEWLNERGLVLLASGYGHEFYAPRYHGNGPYIPVITTGPTPRSRKQGDYHCVVFMDEKMVFDPHPDESGLTAVVYRHRILREV